MHCITTATPSCVSKGHMEMGNLSCDHHSLMSVMHEEDGKIPSLHQHRSKSTAAVAATAVAFTMLAWLL